MTESELDKSALGWSLYLQYATTIEKFARKFFGKLQGSEFEDARSEFILRVVEKAHTLDLSEARQERMLVSSWLGFQAMAVRKTMGRRFGKSCRERSGMRFRDDETSTDALERAAGHEASSEDFTSEIEDTADAESIAAELYAVAEPMEKRAMITVLHDFTTAEVKAEGFKTITARNLALKALGAREGARYAI